MKKIFLLATAAFLITGISFADTGKNKKKKKSSKCCSKGHSCSKDKEKTATM
ncbi:MAG: hypothetical protein ABIN36_06995 [Ferruginibacter sp.]